MRVYELEYRERRCSNEREDCGVFGVVRHDRWDVPEWCDKSMSCNFHWEIPPRTNWEWWRTCWERLDTRCRRDSGRWPSNDLRGARAGPEVLSCHWLRIVRFDIIQKKLMTHMRVYMLTHVLYLIARPLWEFSKYSSPPFRSGCMELHKPSTTRLELFWWWGNAYHLQRLEQTGTLTIIKLSLQRQFVHEILRPNL